MLIIRLRAPPFDEIKSVPTMPVNLTLGLKPNKLEIDLDIVKLISLLKLEVVSVFVNTPPVRDKIFNEESLG